MEAPRGLINTDTAFNAAALLVLALLVQAILEAFALALLNPFAPVKFPCHSRIRLLHIAAGIAATRFVGFWRWEGSVATPTERGV